MEYGMIIAVAAGLISELLGQGKDAEAGQLRRQAAAEIGGVNLPHLDRAVAEQLPDNLRQRYTASTQSTNAQSDALRRFGQEVDQRGETPEDRAAFLRSQQASASTEAGNRSAALRGLSERGLGGSGMESALLMQGAQSATDRAATANTEEAANARQRYLSALSGMGNLAGQMRGQELDTMHSQDAISLFNARAREDANRYNLGLNQQNFQNQMTRATARSNASQGLANAVNAEGNDIRRVGSAVGQLGQGVGSAIDFGQAYEEEKKKGGK